MDDSLNELYQEIILEHNKNPRNKGKLAAPARSAQGYNPSCGDDITVFADIENDKIKAIKFEGEGCAISQASASLMTEILLGKARNEALKIIKEVCTALSSNEDITSDNLSQYGELTALIGVKKFPMRIKCATLAWHAAKDAIEQNKTQV